MKLDLKQMAINFFFWNLCALVCVRYNNRDVLLR